MSRDAFHAEIATALYRGSLPDWQREPLDRLIEEGLRRERTLQEVAYVLATCHHETGRFKHLEEIGKGEGKPYGDTAALMGTGSRVTRWAVYYGRGWVQETWLANYARLSIAASLYFGRPIDLVSEPDLLIRDRALMAWSVWDGFITGRWTGQNLADHIRPGAVDYVTARRIVNGDDAAETIAGYARAFERALTLLGDEPPAPALCDACPYRRTA